MFKYWLAAFWNKEISYPAPRQAPHVLASFTSRFFMFGLCRKWLLKCFLKKIQSGAGEGKERGEKMWGGWRRKTSLIASHGWSQGKITTRVEAFDRKLFSSSFCSSFPVSQRFQLEWFTSKVLCGLKVIIISKEVRLWGYQEEADPSDKTIKQQSKWNPKQDYHPVQCFRSGV